MNFGETQFEPITTTAFCYQAKSVWVVWGGWGNRVCASPESVKGPAHSKSESLCSWYLPNAREGRPSENGDVGRSLGAVMFCRPD